MDLGLRISAASWWNRPWPEERLIRVISHGPSVIDLLNGHLNVTRTGLFVTLMDNEARYDTREAAETTVDCERHAMFFGSLADQAASIRAESRTAVLNNSYLSCWFRVGEGAAIERLVMKFADKGECAVVLTSVRRWMSAWRPSCEPGGYFSELLAVKYLDSLGSDWRFSRVGHAFPCTGTRFQRPRASVASEAR